MPYTFLFWFIPVHACKVLNGLLCPEGVTTHLYFGSLPLAWIDALGSGSSRLHFTGRALGGPGTVVSHEGETTPVAHHYLWPAQEPHIAPPTGEGFLFKALQGRPYVGLPPWPDGVACYMETELALDPSPGCLSVRVL